LLLNGAHLEGGGQLLRLSLTISTLTSVPITISSIRGHRPRGGGLKKQHQSAAVFLSRLCGSSRHPSVGDTSFTFTPDRSGGLRLHFRDKKRGWLEEVDIGSPGAIALVLQVVVPALLFTSLPGVVRD